MKTAKKLLSVLLALTMVLSLGAVTAFAAGNTTPGAITIQNATAEKTYEAFKVFDATVGVNGEVAYTIDSTSPWYNVVNGSNLFTLNEIPSLTTADKTVYNVIRNSGNSDTDIVDLFKGHFTYNPNSESWSCDITGVTAADSETATGSVVTLDVPYGYYLITSTLGSLVTIDTNNPTATVIDKNQGPSWDNGNDNPGKVIIDAKGEKKTITSANYGDSISFDVGVNATNYVGADQVTYYYIKDELDDAFTYDLTGDPKAFHPTVTVGETGLTEGTDYTVSVNGSSFEIAIKWANITTDTDGKIASITSLYAANAEIHVRYSATVNADGEDVVIGGSGNKNTANFTYKTDRPGNTPDNPKTPYDDNKEKTTTTYVYALGFQKVDENYNPLAKAEFTTAPLNVVKESDGVYKLCSAAAEGATQTVVTDNNGQIIIKGVAAGTYTFSETKAPEGYNLLTAPFEVAATLTESYTNTTIITYYFDADGNLVNTNEQPAGGSTKTYATTVDPVFGVGIVNHSGTELPSTGGIGTTIFYVIGGILMAGATVLLVTKKKLSASEE